MQALIKGFKTFVVLVAHKTVFCHQQYENMENLLLQIDYIKLVQKMNI